MVCRRKSAVGSSDFAVGVLQALEGLLYWWLAVPRNLHTSRVCLWSETRHGARQIGTRQPHPLRVGRCARYQGSRGSGQTIGFSTGDVTSWTRCLSVGARVSLRGTFASKVQTRVRRLLTDVQEDCAIQLLVHDVGGEDLVIERLRRSDGRRHDERRVRPCRLLFNLFSCFSSQSTRDWGYQVADSDRPGAFNGLYLDWISGKNAGEGKRTPWNRKRRKIYISVKGRGKQKLGGILALRKRGNLICMAGLQKLCEQRAGFRRPLIIAGRSLGNGPLQPHPPSRTSILARSEPRPQQASLTVIVLEGATAPMQPMQSRPCRFGRWGRGSATASSGPASSPPEAALGTASSVALPPRPAAWRQIRSTGRQISTETRPPSLGNDIPNKRSNYTHAALTRGASAVGVVPSASASWTIRVSNY